MGIAAPGVREVACDNGAENREIRRKIVAVVEELVPPTHTHTHLRILSGDCDKIASAY